MSDYIKREDATHALDTVKMRLDDTWYEFYQRALTNIKDLPSADVVERKRGKWRHDSLRGLLLPQCMCSECGLYVEQEANFCPNCGVDMRGMK